MTDRDWREVLRICDAATPGEWKNGKPSDSIVSTYADVTEVHYKYYGGFCVAESVYHHDKPFITNARAMFPEAVRSMIALDEWEKHFEKDAAVGDPIAISLVRTFQAVKRGEGPK